jgi:hypothetical protein
MRGTPSKHVRHREWRERLIDLERDEPLSVGRRRSRRRRRLSTGPRSEEISSSLIHVGLAYASIPTAMSAQTRAINDPIMHRDPHQFCGRLLRALGSYPCDRLIESAGVPVIVAGLGSPAHCKPVLGRSTRETSASM